MKNCTLVVLSILLLTGCAAEQRTIRYYTIDAFALTPLNREDRVQRPPLPFVVEVGDFSTAGPYNDTRIALRTEANEIQYFYFHQWAELPGQAVRYFVWRVLNEERVFDVCQLRFSVTVPQLIVTGAINQLERIDMDDRTGANINMSFELVDMREQRVLVVHDFRRMVPFPAHAPMNIFANEVSRVLLEEVQSFIDKIYEHFRAD